MVHPSGWIRAGCDDFISMWLCWLIVDLLRTCTQLLMQVLELIGTRWGVAAAPIKVTTSASDWSRTSGNSSTKLNKDAPPFVPSEPLSEPYEFETVYNYQAAEQPVAHRGELKWQTFNCS